MQTKLVTTEELKQARNLLVHQVLLANSSTHKTALGLLRLAQMDLPLDEPTRAAHIYQKITAKQIKSAFLRWIRPSGFVQITSGPVPK